MPKSSFPLRMPAMKRLITASLVLFVAPLIPAQAASLPPDTLTVRQEVELFTAISALDKGGSKLIDGKEAHVPFVLTAATRWTLSYDSSLVKADAENFTTLRDSIVGKIAGAQAKDDPAASAKMNAQVDKELTPILDAAGRSLTFHKVSLADLSLDTNPIDVSTLTGLRPIISDQ